MIDINKLKAVGLLIIEGQISKSAINLNAAFVDLFNIESFDYEDDFYHGK